MIKSEIIKIDISTDFDNIYDELLKRYKSVIRWAITDIGEYITVNVSYEQ